jgi:hypothetical protein
MRSSRAHPQHHTARRPRKRLLIAALTLLACGPSEPTERYGFITRLGSDTISLESVTRRGNTVTSDAVDRFPRVRQRHTEIEVSPNGGIRRLVMDIRTPSEPADQRDRRVTVDVTNDSVRISKRDRAGTVRRAFATGGGVAMAHVPQLYSLYELYFVSAGKRAAGSTADSAQTVRFRQFYIDREFDRYPLHNAAVRLLPDGKAEIRHDWLAGIGEATLDSNYRLLRYSGARTTYKVDVVRLAEVPDLDSIRTQFAAVEAARGGVRQLSVRDTTRASIGAASFTVDYGRPLRRGRELLGNIIPYDRVWRTGANAATQFTTSATITLAGIKVPPGTYTLWTVPRQTRADLIVNKQAGQWGTGYDGAHDLGMAPMAAERLERTVEQFTIAIVPADDKRGTLVLEWGTFRWTAPIVVLDAGSAAAAIPTG